MPSTLTRSAETAKGTRIGRQALLVLALELCWNSWMKLNTRSGRPLATTVITYRPGERAMCNGTYCSEEARRQSRVCVSGIERMTAS